MSSMRNTALNVQSLLYSSEQNIRFCVILTTRLSFSKPLSAILDSSKRVLIKLNAGLFPDP